MYSEETYHKWSRDPMHFLILRAWRVFFQLCYLDIDVIVLPILFSEQQLCRRCRYLIYSVETLHERVREMCRQCAETTSPLALQSKVSDCFGAVCPFLRGSSIMIFKFSFSLNVEHPFHHLPLSIHPTFFALGRRAYYIRLVNQLTRTSCVEGEI